MPSYIQRSFDYIGTCCVTIHRTCLTLFPDAIAPEYALDEALITASDMYSLGCLIYAVHCKGTPPFRNHGSLGGVRDNAGRPVPDIGQLDTDLQGYSIHTRE